MVFRTAVSRLAGKRVPLIKFRKGGPDVVATTSQGQTAGYSSAAIEDWQLPPRFQRKPLSAEEIEYINRGGPA